MKQKFSSIMKSKFTHTAWVVLQTYFYTGIGYLVVLGTLTALKYQIVIQQIIVTPIGK